MGKKPTTEPILRMRPPPWARMCGSTARVMRTTPWKFVSKMARAVDEPALSDALCAATLAQFQDAN